MEPTNQPYTPSPAKIAHIQVLQTWMRLAGETDLATQNAGCRVAIEIGGLDTHWSQGLTEASPPFVQTSVGGSQFLLLYAGPEKVLGIYERFGRDWKRSTLLRHEAEILAALPARALRAELPATPATEKQLAALRKFLALPPAQLMPAISGAMCSRLLDRLTVERAISELRDDFATWVATDAYVPTIEA